MSETSRTVLAGTAPVAQAYQSAIEGVTQRASLRRQRDKDNVKAIMDLGDTLGRYKTWKDAKEAEDEQKQILDAYRLGAVTGDARNKYAALRALQTAKHLDSAKLMVSLTNQTSKDIIDEGEFKLRQAQQFQAEAHAAQAEKRQAMLDIERINLEREKSDAAKAKLGVVGKDILTPDRAVALGFPAEWGNLGITVAAAQAHQNAINQQNARDNRPAKEPDIVTPEMAQALGYPPEWVGQKSVDARASASRLGLGRPEPKAKVVVPETIEGRIKDAERALDAKRDEVKGDMYRVWNQDDSTKEWDPGTSPEEVLAEYQRAVDAARKAKDDYIAQASRGSTQIANDPPPQMPADPAQATDEQLKAYEAWKKRHP